MWLHYKIILFLSCLFLSCASTSVSFSTKKVYIADNFTDHTLSGTSIGIGPILSKRGLNLDDSMSCEQICKIVSANRPDLMIISYNRIRENFSSKFSVHQCDSLFLQLYSKNSYEVQLLDSMWNLINCDYVLLVRLKDAMSIKTFGDVDKKRVSLDAELWNRKDQETILRIELQGVADGKKITDKQFLLDVMAKIFSEIPKTVPSYENGKW